MTTADETDAGEQLALLSPRAAVRRPRRLAGDDPTAEHLPVALVQVDTGLAHLDRPFEYTVPASMTDTAGPGVRVKVRFAGQDLDGFVLERRADAEHLGRLSPLRRVVSPEPVLDPAGARRRPGGRRPVRRLARRRAAPRGAAAARHGREGAGGRPARAPPRCPSGRRRRGRRMPPGRPSSPTSPRAGAPTASLLAAPSVDAGRDWPVLLAEAARAAVEGGRGAVLVVPDHRDVVRVEAALLEVLGPGRHTRLTADQGPQARYTAYLKALRGHAQVVVGTRAAAFAPVHDLGLVAWWDDGDDLLDEPRAPYPHVREVLLTRAQVHGAAVLSAGFSRSVAVADLVARGALTPLEAPRAVLRRAVPSVRVAGEGHDADRDPAVAAAHLPTIAWRTAKEALEHGPVLVQVPRRGYLPSLSCQECRRPARCTACAGPLGLPGPQGPPACRWCGRVETGFACPACGGHRLRSSVVGARRTAEELGRAFPGVPVERSGAGHRARHRRRRATPGRVDPRRRAGRPRRVRRGPAARRLGADRAAEPHRGGGGPAPVAGRGGAGAAGIRRRSGGARRGARPRCRSRPSRRSCAGTPPGSPSASSRSGASCRCPRRPGSPCSPGPRPALEAATAELELPGTASVLGPLPHGADRPVAHPGHRAPRPTARP